MRLYMTNDGDVYLLLTTGRDCYTIEEMAVYRPLEDTGDTGWYIEPLVDFLAGKYIVALGKLSGDQIGAFSTIQNENLCSLEKVPVD
jgi:hypothetical protein